MCILFLYVLVKYMASALFLGLLLLKIPHPTYFNKACIIITSIHAAYENNQKKSHIQRPFFMQINNVIIDGLGGLSLFVHKFLGDQKLYFANKDKSVL